MMPYSRAVGQVMVVERNNHRNRDEDHNYVRPSGAMAKSSEWRKAGTMNYVITALAKKTYNATIQSNMAYRAI